MSHSGRQLPPFHEFVQRRAVRSLEKSLRPPLLHRLAREVFSREREFLGRGRGLAARYGSSQPDRKQLTRFLEKRLACELDELLQPKLKSVINASGVLLHTNLGRALLGDSARGELARVAARPVALEVDLGSGKRGSRNDKVARWLGLLTGAKAALAVNNGAGALWLAVHALGRRRRAVISRGEQVAIGGSFRMPELLKTTGARVIEVGTTNKTTRQDYASVVREGDLVLKVHPSNYRVEGFTEECSLESLNELCQERGATLIYDAGSGCLRPLGKKDLEGEMTVTQALKAGAQVVTFSGDKLLGGPQAGLIVGDEDKLRRLAKHPMMRALRLDKLILAALEATLKDHALPGSNPSLPLYQALGLSIAELRRRARWLKERIEPGLPLGWKLEWGKEEGMVGGGSLAQQPVGSVGLRLRGPKEQSAQKLHTALRRGDPAVLARIGKGLLRLDMRTLREEDLPVLADRIVRLLQEEKGS